MGPGEHRPHDEEYWTAPWSTALFAGDLFEAIPFGDQPPEQTGAVADSLKLLRSRDTLHPYMYLPALPGVLEEESVACLFRPSLVSDELLAEPPHRVAQLQPEARRHLKVKLAAYWGRVAVDPKELPLQERGEDDLRAADWPPSRYDDPGALTVKRG